RLLTEDGEAHTGRVEARRECPGDPPIALVEGGRTADPVEHLDFVEPAVGRKRGDCWHLEGQAACPVGSGRAGLAPRVADTLHVPHRAGHFLRKATLVEDEVAT